MVTHCGIWRPSCLNTQWVEHYDKWKAKGLVGTQNDTVGSARVEPEALTYTLTGTVAKATADTIGEKFSDVQSEA